MTEEAAKLSHDSWFQAGRRSVFSDLEKMREGGGGMSDGYVWTLPPPTRAELLATIEDCDAVLAAAAAGPPVEAGSLKEMCLQTTQSHRDRAAAALATMNLMDGIASTAGKGRRS